MRTDCTDTRKRKTVRRARCARPAGCTYRRSARETLDSLRSQCTPAEWRFVEEADGDAAKLARFMRCVTRVRILSAKTSWACVRRARRFSNAPLSRFSQRLDGEGSLREGSRNRFVRRARLCLANSRRRASSKRGVEECDARLAGVYTDPERLECLDVESANPRMRLDGQEQTVSWTEEGTNSLFFSRGFPPLSQSADGDFGV